MAMSSIIPGRMTAARDQAFVVFLIGVRINKPLRVDQWWPVVTAMPRMIRELQARPDLGFLGVHNWFGRTTIMLQYWESFDKLEAYAKSRDHAHLPAWRDFNRRVGASGDVGVWHETYAVTPGSYECIYSNMPPFGLGRVGPLVSAQAARDSARGRMGSEAGA
jgi:hypothetical protein